MEDAPWNAYDAPRKTGETADAIPAPRGNPNTPLIIVGLYGVFGAFFFVHMDRLPMLVTCAAYALLVARAVREYKKKKVAHDAWARAERRRRREAAENRATH